MLTVDFTLDNVSIAVKKADGKPILRLAAADKIPDACPVNDFAEAIKFAFIFFTTEVDEVALSPANLAQNPLAVASSGGPALKAAISAVAVEICVTTSLCCFQFLLQNH